MTKPAALYPGMIVLALTAYAQDMYFFIAPAAILACAIIALSRLPEGTDRKNSLFYFAGIDKARFKQVVQPGDQLMIEGKFIRSKLGLGIFEAVARVDGKVVAQAEMMCAYRPVAPKTSDAGKQA